MKYIVQPVEWDNYKRKWRKLAGKTVVSIDGNGTMQKFAEAYFAPEKFKVTPLGREHHIRMNEAFEKDSKKEARSSSGFTI